MAENTENATFLFQLVIVEGMGGRKAHGSGSGKVYVVAFDHGSAGGSLRIIFGF
jgi:hypothetical protein